MCMTQIYICGWFCSDALMLGIVLVFSPNFLKQGPRAKVQGQRPSPYSPHLCALCSATKLYFPLIFMLWKLRSEGDCKKEGVVCLSISYSWGKNSSLILRFEYFLLIAIFEIKYLVLSLCQLGPIVWTIWRCYCYIRCRSSPCSKHESDDKE